MNKNEKIIDIYKEEFSKLKDEQIGRIGFRDNLIYVTLVVVGSIFAFVITNKGANEILLIIPWVSFILGWTYIANDEKITSIGKYIKTEWKNKVLGLLNEKSVGIMEWESFHKSDDNRTRRKTFQFIVDALVFVAPGALALFFLPTFHDGSFEYRVTGMMVFEVFLLLVMVIELWRHADFSK